MINLILQFMKITLEKNIFKYNRLGRTDIFSSRITKVFFLMYLNMAFLSFILKLNLPERDSTLLHIYWSPSGTLTSFRSVLRMKISVF